MSKDNVSPILELSRATTGYGRKPVIRRVNIDLHVGEVVALIGHNGAGKSTLLKAAFGALPLWEGKVRVDGAVVDNHNPRSALAQGITFVPQGHRVFNSLSVRENLEVAVRVPGVSDQDSGTSKKEQLKPVRRELPEISERFDQLAGSLSGGEQQMVGLGMALVRKPRCLLLDEPSLGLAPNLARRLLETVTDWAEDGSLGILVVEQKVREVLRVSDRVIVLRNGRISHKGLAAELHENDKLLREVYL